MAITPEETELAKLHELVKLAMPETGGGTLTFMLPRAPIIFISRDRELSDRNVPVFFVRTFQRENDLLELGSVLYERTHGEGKLWHIVEKESGSFLFVPFLFYETQDPTAFIAAMEGYLNSLTQKGLAVWFRENCHVTIDYKGHVYKPSMLEAGYRDEVQSLQISILFGPAHSQKILAEIEARQAVDTEKDPNAIYLDLTQGYLTKLCNDFGEGKSSKLQDLFNTLSEGKVQLQSAQPIYHWDGSRLPAIMVEVTPQSHAIPAFKITTEAAVFLRDVLGAKWVRTVDISKR